MSKLLEMKKKYEAWQEETRPQRESWEAYTKLYWEYYKGEREFPEEELKAHRDKYGYS